MDDTPRQPNQQLFTNEFNNENTSSSIIDPPTISQQLNKFDHHVAQLQTIYSDLTRDEAEQMILKDKSSQHINQTVGSYNQQFWHPLVDPDTVITPIQTKLSLWERFNPLTRYKSYLIYDRTPEEIERYLVVNGRYPPPKFHYSGKEDCHTVILSRIVAAGILSYPTGMTLTYLTKGAGYSTGMRVPFIQGSFLIMGALSVLYANYCSKACLDYQMENAKLARYFGAIVPIRWGLEEYQYEKANQHKKNEAIREEFFPTHPDKYRPKY